MVDAPTTEPASFRLLFTPDVVDRIHHQRVGHIFAQATQSFHHVGCDVDTGRIQGFTKVAERDQGHQFFVVVLVEGCPGSIAASHPHHPAQATGDRGRDSLLEFRVVGVAAGQHDQGHGGVVDVGVDIVLVLESPAPGFQFGALHFPVAPGFDLLTQQPIDTAVEVLFARADAAIEESQLGQQGVPNGRGASLQESSLRLVHGPRLVETAPAFLHHRVVQGIPLEAQGHQRVDPGGLNPGPASVSLLATNDPLQAAPDSVLSGRLPG